jgi:hypothetical protein
MKTILGRCDQISVTQIGSKNTWNANNTSYGINGTFFYSTSPPTQAAADGYVSGNVYRISAMNGTKISGQPKGDINRLDAAGSGNCGTFYVYKNSSSSAYFSTATTKATNLSDLPVSTSLIKFAVGGIDLMLNQSFSNQTAYFNAVTDHGNANYTDARHRTAILGIPVSGSHHNVLLMTVFGQHGNSPNSLTTLQENGGVNAWELYSLIKTYYPTATGVLLDGGGSTQIVFQSQGIRKCIATADKNGNIRNVPTMIRIPWLW